MRVVPKSATQASSYFFSIYVDASNDFSIYGVSTSKLYYRKKIAAVSELKQIGGYSTDLTRLLVAQTSKGTFSKIQKFSGGSWSSWTLISSETDMAKTQVPIPGAYAIGSFNSTYQFTANYPRTAIIAMPPKATLAEYQTWIEEELTRRGLI